MNESNVENELPEDDEPGEATVQDGETLESGENGARPKRRRRKRRTPGEEAKPRDDGPSELPDDAMAARALGFLTDVIEEMGLDCRVHLRRPRDEEDQDISLELTGPDAARIIGKRGQTLSALQFLTSRILNRPGMDRRYVTVDAEGYRSRRDNSLAAMAKRLGSQAVSDGKIITFEPMSPRDRRLVHLALAKFEGVITKSEGDGEDRRVQIIPVRRGASASS